jgi:hypothetical protein
MAMELVVQTWWFWRPEPLEMEFAVQPGGVKKNMTEQQWLESADPAAMLDFLMKKERWAFVRSKLSSRKLRLFACGCLRPVSQTGCAAFQRAIEVAERYADGTASRAELKNTYRAAYAVADPRPWWVRLSDGLADDVWDEPDELSLAVVNVASPNVRKALQLLLKEALPYLSILYNDRIVKEGQVPRYLCRLLRCVFGNPFGDAVIDPCCLERSSATVVKLAQAIYDSRRFADMPILADALEEAGCTDDLVAHCRFPNEHIRGCWVLDSILQKL